MQILECEVSMICIGRIVTSKHVFLRDFCREVFKLTQLLGSMNAENRSLITDEPVEIEK